jgi:hypothetical protein
VKAGENELKQLNWNISCIGFIFWAFWRLYWYWASHCSNYPTQSQKRHDHQCMQLGLLDICDTVQTKVISWKKRD